MLADKELDQTAAQLADFRAANEQHHATLSEFLEKYTTLIDDYKRLKSDYEEERDSRERYKQMARGQERNPFVLVLVDGDGYVFEDDLVSTGTEGGQQAARLLHDAVKDSLRSRGLDHCRIMVRVYANLAGLSKHLSKAKLTGPEKRSLAPFAASFTRSYDLFDFVDAGDLKENADFKIRAMFRQFAENAQCRHIYFAGCHDVGYVSELTPYVGNRDRITLIRTPAFHHEYTRLGMRVEDFPNVFRTMPLEGQPSLSSMRTPPAPNTQYAAVPATESAGNICTFFQKGMCKYGNNCRFLHVKANTNGTHPTTGTARSLSDIKDWRQNGSGEKATVPFGLPSLTKSDNDFMTGNSDPVQLQIDFATQLPRAEDIAHGEIPVNKHQHRLDAYIPHPSREDSAAYYTRIANKKLCNNFHINGNCPNGDSCKYDHSPASPGILNCLEQVVRSMPCPRRGGCRSVNCLNGHICQKADCQRRGGKQYCKFSLPMHIQDLQLAQYVSGTGAKDIIDDFETTTSVSGQTWTPPSAEARSSGNGSDMEEEEGALLDLRDATSVD
ncbi:hypothetical protein LTR37_012223 [Vermiconidia calcicola]|uniref:Uncharacterized protein n=1 Tax=Vermiconidia calcicola TaxID=1690605 RepID=A0ACC3N135_9PEZI|nr:hypothetical protein LTR37_012223 [Vermiconidia calcicola]